MGVDRATAELVLVRAEGECEACGLRVYVPHLHHRRPRGMGGGGDNSAANLIALHPSCHLTYIESQRQKALDAGWLVRQGDDPADVPVLYKMRGLAHLTEQGEVVWKK